MRDRLIELIKKAERKYLVNGTNIPQMAEFAADYLLENGVIVPPCKVGQIVYFVARNSGKPIGNIDEMEIVMIGKTESGFCAKGKIGENTFDIIPHFEIDNYTFFASQKEAKQALKGGAE